jgi:hypothetical protein
MKSHLLILFACSIAAVNAQVKCNSVSFTVSDGWCKGQALSYKGCFDATKPITDLSSQAAFIALNQQNFKPFSQSMCLQGAVGLCALVGGTARAGVCTDMNNECKADNLANNLGVGACSTDAQCTGFAKSTFNICCSSMVGWVNDLICQNTVKTQVTALYVPPTTCSNDKDCRTAGATSTRAMIHLCTFFAAAILAIVNMAHTI